MKAEAPRRSRRRGASHTSIRFREIALLVAAFAAVACAPPLRAQAPATGRFFVKLRDAAGLRVAGNGLALFADGPLAARAAKWGLRRIVPVMPDAAFRKGTADVDRIALVELSDTLDVRAAMEDLAADPAVEYVEPEHVYRIDGDPNDAHYAEQWGMQRIRAAAAWTRTRGSDAVTIGIIDTGIDYLHEDLRSQLRVNRAEDTNGDGVFEPWPSTESRNGVTGDLDGIDNDGNGFVDDVVGYDFVDEPGYANAAGGDYRDPDPDVADENGHGTAVAGIVAAAADNGIGVAGVAPGCRILPLRAFDARGIGAEGDVARALAYAVANGARVVNMSFGDVQYSRVLRDVIRWASARGVVMVASAGNSQSDELHYPSAYDETISVSASTRNDGLAGFSSYGSTVDIAAPGVDIETTDRNDAYASISGTSASAPFVTGVVALVISLHPEFGPEDVRGILMTSADDPRGDGWDVYLGAGIVDAERAVALDHPTTVRIVSPKTDAGIVDASVPIVGTVASPFVTGYALQYGYGDDPRTWIDIVPPVARQVIDDTLAVWDVGALPDTTYTIRLLASGAGGNSIEDRVVVHIERAPPRILGIGFIPCIDGDESGVAVGFLSETPTLGRLYYRPQGTSDPFRWIALESGSENTLFVSGEHHAFVGRPAFTPGRTYEMYLSATGSGGRESIATDANGKYFTFAAAQPVPRVGFTAKPYGLPAARLFRRTTDFNGNGLPEILVNEYAVDGRFGVYERSGGGFARIGGDAQGQNIPRGVGDANGNGRTDLLSSFVRTAYLDEAAAAIALPTERLAQQDNFWPIAMADVNDDGVPEILGVVDDSAIAVCRYQSGGLVRLATIFNPTPPDPATRHNSFNAPRVAIGDFNGNGHTDLLFGDADGDFFIVENRGGTDFHVIWASDDDYVDGSDFVAAGDFDGDGRTEFAIAVRTAPDDVIPFWFAGIYKMNSSNVVTPLWTQIFYGVEEPASSGAFNRIDNSMTAGRLDGGRADKLILSFFPELYVIGYDSTRTAFAPIWMAPLVNTNAAVIGDFDGNGVPEFGVTTPDSVVFFERDPPSGAPAPVRSIDAQYVNAHGIRLSWTADPAPPQYRLYRGTTAADLALFGVFADTAVTDLDVQEGRTYLYAVAAYDSTKSPRESPRLFSRSFHPHTQPAIDTVVANGEGQATVTVTQDMGTVIPPVAQFVLDGGRAPESVALLDRHALLLSFGTLAAGQHALGVPGLRDAEGIPFDDREAATFAVPVPEKNGCYIESVVFEPPRTLAVRFHEAVEKASAEVPAHYVVDLLGPAVAAALDTADASLVRVTFGGTSAIGALGRAYVLTVTGVRCLGGDAIVSGAGATASVVIHRETLDDVFVYPNPWRERDGRETVTFANLTRRATIRIYTLSGTFLAEVTENDGNGGTDWDLRDRSGARVPAGIYLYYVSGFNSAGDAVEPRSGKFAVVH